MAEARLIAILAASASGVCAGPLTFDVMSHFSSRLRFWSARGTDVTATCGEPALGGGRPWGSVLAFAGLSGARARRGCKVCGARGPGSSRSAVPLLWPSVGRSVCRRSSRQSLLSWTPLLSLETVAEVPFELYQQHLIVTKGSIGPLNGLSLLIDTGTIPSMVDNRIARKLHVQAEPSMLVAFGQSVAIQSTILNGFRIGARQPGPVPAGVSDLSYLEGVRIDAIVGLDVLARTSFSIDYRKRVLRFSADDREESVAPLELVWPFVTVQMTIGGQQVRLLVDTGSSDLVLFKSRMPAALSHAPWRGDKTVQYASGAARLQRLDLRQVRLGARVWDKLTAWALDRVLDGYPPSIDGVLGVLALDCRRVQFDFKRNEFGCSP